MAVLPRLLVAFGALTATFPAHAQIPLAPDPYTAYVAAAINAGRPPILVRIEGPLTLEARLPGGGVAQISLDRIYAACRADQTRCPAIVSDFAARTNGLLATPQSPAAPAQPTQASLRVGVRPEAYVRSLPQLGGAPVPRWSRSLPPGLVALVYEDTPTAMRLMGVAQLQALRLSEDQAFAAALQNTAREIAPHEPAYKLVREGQIGFVNGNAYDSSRLLLLSNWSTLASQSTGRLLVAAPSPDEILYANGSGYEALSVLARERYRKAKRPLSPAVYEWRPTGWIVAAP